MVKLPWRLLGLVGAMSVVACTTIIGLRDDYHLADGGSDATAPAEGGADGTTEAAAASDGGPEGGSDAATDGRDAGDAGNTSDTGVPADAPPEASYDGPPSCQGLEAGCGPAGALESCCASTYVEGGTFVHEVVGVPPDASTLAEADSGVSDFRLDKYLVTVGRFRNFAAAMDAGWYPQNGQGKHAYLPEGGVWSTIENAPEEGWRDEYDTIPASTADWSSELTTAEGCTPNATMWTAQPGALDNHPINCVPWEGAYAFCIWDGGFLATDAEFNYAQLGGSEQRLYPWSVPPGDAGIDPTNASYGPGNGQCYGTSGFPHTCTQFDHTIPGSFPSGNGKWGQADLVGDIPEYTLDCFTPIPSGCTDCGPITACAGTHVVRTALDDAPTSWLINAVGQQEQSFFLPLVGFRCARAP